MAACLALAGPAFGASDHRVVTAQDDCDPVTFNDAIGPGTCVGEGRTLFSEFAAELQAQGSVDDWAFSRDEFGLDAGGTVEVVNEGGETHSFTRVDKFGNGCVPPLNPNDDPPAADCATVTFIPAGETTTVAHEDLQAGTNRFQCMIHPWMRSTVEVEAGDGGHDD